MYVDVTHRDAFLACLFSELPCFSLHPVRERREKHLGGDERKFLVFGLLYLSFTEGFLSRWKEPWLILPFLCNVQVFDNLASTVLKVLCILDYLILKITQ